jgi:hypothetical protein
VCGRLAWASADPAGHVTSQGEAPGFSGSGGPKHGGVRVIRG